MRFLLKATKLRFCPYSQGGDFTVLLKGELRGINSFSGLCSQRKILP